VKKSLQKAELSLPDTGPSRLVVFQAQPAHKGSTVWFRAGWDTPQLTLLEIRASGRLASLNFISPHSGRRVAEKFKQGLSGKPDH